MMDENGTQVMPARREKARRTRRVKASTAGAASKGASSRQWQRAGRPSRRPARTETADDREAILIKLSKSQVDQVVRSAGQGGTLSVLLSAVRDPQWTLSPDSPEWSYPAQMEDRRLSRSLLSGLLLLSFRRRVPGDRRTRAHARHEHEHHASLCDHAARSRSARAQRQHA